PSAAQPGYYEGPATPVPGASSIPGAAKGTPGPSGEQLRQQLLDRLAAVTAGTAPQTSRERQIAAMYPGETQTAVQGYDTEVLSASLRHPQHVVESARIGADIATMPFGVMNRLFNHPLTDIGMAGFASDWEAYQQALAEKRS
ncbi:MAG: transaldolase family protein, partial [Actinomycetota bacterium]